MSEDCFPGLQPELAVVSVPGLTAKKGALPSVHAPNGEINSVISPEKTCEDQLSDTRKEAN